MAKPHGVQRTEQLVNAAVDPRALPPFGWSRATTHDSGKVLVHAHLKPAGQYRPSQTFGNMECLQRQDAARVGVIPAQGRVIFAFGHREQAYCISPQHEFWRQAIGHVVLAPMLFFSAPVNVQPAFAALVISHDPHTV